MATKDIWAPVGPNAPQPEPSVPNPIELLLKIRERMQQAEHQAQFQRMNQSTLGQMQAQGGVGLPPGLARAANPPELGVGDPLEPPMPMGGRFAKNMQELTEDPLTMMSGLGAGRAVAGAAVMGAGIPFNLSKMSKLGKDAIPKGGAKSALRLNDGTILFDRSLTPDAQLRKLRQEGGKGAEKHVESTGFIDESGNYVEDTFTKGVARQERLEKAAVIASKKAEAPRRIVLPNDRHEPPVKALEIAEGDSGIILASTPDGKKPLARHIGDRFDLWHMAQHGRHYDPVNNPGDLQRMIDEAIPEFQSQMKQADTGAGWYTDDIRHSMELVGEVIPELHGGNMSAELQTLLTAIAAPTSFANKPVFNFDDAAAILKHFLDEGTLPSLNPATGKGWTIRPATKTGLDFMNFVIDKHGGGYDGVIALNDLLLKPYTIRHLNALKHESGLFGPQTIQGPQDTKVLGARVFGPKGGAFFANLNGLNDTTVDLWLSRMFNRHQGRMTDGTNKSLSSAGMMEAPRTDPERTAMKKFSATIGEEVGLDDFDAQAVLWYFEQRLFSEMGVKSTPTRMSDGARAFRDRGGVARPRND